MFKEAKEMEVMTARKDQVLKIIGLKDGEGKPYFNLKFALDRWLGMTAQDMADNQKMKEKAAEKKKEAEGKKGEGEEGTEEKPGEFKI
jgi:predicted nucleic acid-binding protein